MATHNIIGFLAATIALARNPVFLGAHAMIDDRGRGAAAPPVISATRKLPDNVTSIDLKIEGAGPLTRCFYKTGTGAFTQLGQDLQSSFLSTDTAGGFQGVTLGMFAHN